MIAKIGVKMNFKIIKKNHEADLEIGFLTKSLSKSYGRATAMPQALELTLYKKLLQYVSLFALTMPILRLFRVFRLYN